MFHRHRPISSGAIIRRARTIAGLSQAGLADLVGAEITTVSRWERGERHPSFDRVSLIVNQCGLSLATLLTQLEAERSDHPQGNPATAKQLGQIPTAAAPGRGLQ